MPFPFDSRSCLPEPATRLTREAASPSPFSVESSARNQALRTELPSHPAGYEHCKSRLNQFAALPRLKLKPVSKLG